MRFNTDNYRVVTARNGVSDAEVRKSTGLSEKAFSWILERRFVKCQTLELIADAVGCSVSELALPDSAAGNENCIEWIKGQPGATLTLSQGRYISRIKKLATEWPEDCQIIAENTDGSVCAHIPVTWVKINPPKNLTDGQRDILRRRFANNLNADSSRGDNG